jgi:Rod binding domain-containing protein
MVKAMQKSVPEGSLMPSGPSKGLYEHMMQQAMVENLSGSGGLGIGEALTRAQSSLRRGGGSHRVQPSVGPSASLTRAQERPARAAAPLKERASATSDSLEHASSGPEVSDLSNELPPQDNSWLDSPFAEAHLRRLLSTPSDRK